MNHKEHLERAEKFAKENLGQLAKEYWEWLETGTISTHAESKMSELAIICDKIAGSCATYLARDMVQNACVEYVVNHHRGPNDKVPS